MPKLDLNSRILIVDDSESMRLLICTMLNQIGYRYISSASCGSLALKMLLEKKFDLVVSDWSMPDGDGIELIKAIRRCPDMCNLPFIMVTSNNRKPEVTAAIQAGISNYIVKPFTVETLESKVQAVSGSMREAT